MYQYASNVTGVVQIKIKYGWCILETSVKIFTN